MKRVAEFEKANILSPRSALLRARREGGQYRKPMRNDGVFLYMVRCVDGSIYAGTTRGSLELRIAQHNAGTFGGYTSTRRPVTLIYSEWFNRITDAIAAERQVKRWSRGKKLALANGDRELLSQLARRRSERKE